MKLLTFLFLALLIFIPLGVLLRIPVIVPVYIYPTDILVGLIFCVSLIEYHKNFKLIKGKILTSIVLFLGFAIVGLLLNSFYLKPQELFTAFLYLLRFAAYTNLLFSVRYTHQSFRTNLLSYLSVFGFIIVILGFIQYFLYPALRNLYYLGWDEHLYRMFSTFLDPNFLGAFFVLLLVVLTSTIVSLNAKVWHSKSGKIESIFYQLVNREGVMRWILAAATFLTLIALFLTYSRTAYIMLIVSILTYLSLIQKRQWVVGVIIICAVALLIIPKSTKIEGMNPFRTASSFERIKQYNYAITIFQDSPVWGIGFDTYRYAQFRHKYITHDVNTTHAGAGVPNSWLVILVTTGTIGFFLYLNFWWQVIRQLFKQRKIYSSSLSVKLGANLRQKVSENPLSKIGEFQYSQTKNYYVTSGIIASLVAIFIGSIFENLLLYPFIMIWMYILVGVMVDNEL